MSATTTEAPQVWAPAPKKSVKALWLLGLVTSLAVAGFVSYYASASPDGLNKVAADHGMDKKAERHATEDSPFAGYETRDVANPRLSGGLAGVIGVGATLALGTSVFWAVRRGTPQPTAGSASSAQDG